MGMATVNNDFYEELEEKWYTDWSHPIALLRKENEVRNPWILETIHRILGPGKKILDVGCGGGFLTNALAQAGHDAVGIDLSANSLKVASAKDATKSVRYIQADALHLPFPENSFDVVCAMDLLEHVERPDRIVAEASRVLKQKGLFFFHTFNRNPLSWLIIIKGVEWWMPSTPKRLHVYELFIKPEELNHWCGREQIHIRKIQGLTPKFSLRFWMSFIKRKVDERISFQFTSSLKTGYVGFGEKMGSINEGV
jgi:2-polyprenyl-6-hydroxyphenyl methylase/3-demethylubiquinone-9 3-methyltransferase